MGGSFFTTILGCPALLLSDNTIRSFDRNQVDKDQTYDLGDLFPSEGVLSLALIPLFISGVMAYSEVLVLGVAMIEGARGG